MAKTPEKKKYFAGRCPRCKTERGVYEKPTRGISKDGRKYIKGRCWSCGRVIIKYTGKKKK